MMYLIPTENMESFEKKIARIRRKAERAKVDFSYKRLEPIQKETDLPGVTVECVPVMVECKIHCPHTRYNGPTIYFVYLVI